MPNKTSRLENAADEGPFLAMLKRIAATLKKRNEIRVISLNEKL